MKIWAMKLTNENRGEGRIEMRHTLKESKGVGDWLDINMAPVFWTKNKKQKWNTWPDNHEGTFEFSGAEYLLSGPTPKIHIEEFF